MEASALKAHEYCKQLKQDRLNEHRRLNFHERPCSGLNDKEWLKAPTRQKMAFSKSKKFAVSRLWNYHHVSTQQGLESLTIKTI
jgi:hypothetical protein